MFLKNKQATAISLWYFEFYLFVSLLFRHYFILSQERWSWFSLFPKNPCMSNVLRCFL